MVKTRFQATKFHIPKFNSLPTKIPAANLSNQTQSQYHYGGTFHQFLLSVIHIQKSKSFNSISYPLTPTSNLSMPMQLVKRAIKVHAHMLKAFMQFTCINKQAIIGVAYFFERKTCFLQSSHEYEAKQVVTSQVIQRHRYIPIHESCHIQLTEGIPMQSMETSLCTYRGFRGPVPKQSISIRDEFEDSKHSLISCSCTSISYTHLGALRLRFNSGPSAVEIPAVSEDARLQMEMLAHILKIFLI